MEFEVTEPRISHKGAKATEKIFGDFALVCLTENAVAREIVDAAYRVHTRLGPGLLESVYEAALAWELGKRGHSVTRQLEIPVIYEGVHIRNGFLADLIVDDLVIVEIKAVEAVAPVHKKQLLTYLKLSGKRLGLLINFNVVLVRDGIVRIINSPLGFSQHDPLPGSQLEPSLTQAEGPVREGL
jgi:GxxExxY protein